MKRKRVKKRIKKAHPSILFYYRNHAFAFIQTRSHKYLGAFKSGGIEFGGVPYFDAGKSLKDLLTPKRLTIKVSVDDYHYMECKGASIKESIVSGSPYKPYVRIKLAFNNPPTLLPHQ